MSHCGFQDALNAILLKGIGYIYLISQKRLEKNFAEKTMKIISEEIIMRYVQL
jgi:hypothetical protein